MAITPVDIIPKNPDTSCSVVVVHWLHITTFGFKAKPVDFVVTGSIVAKSEGWQVRSWTYASVAGGLAGIDTMCVTRTCHSLVGEMLCDAVKWL